MRAEIKDLHQAMQIPFGHVTHDRAEGRLLGLGFYTVVESTI